MGTRSLLAHFAFADATTMGNGCSSTEETPVPMGLPVKEHLQQATTEDDSKRAFTDLDVIASERLVIIVKPLIGQSMRIGPLFPSDTIRDVKAMIKTRDST